MFQRGTKFSGSDLGQWRGVRLKAGTIRDKKHGQLYWNVTVTAERVNYSVQDHRDEKFQADD